MRQTLHFHRNRGSQELVFYCENRSGFSNQKFKHIEQKMASDMELGSSQR